MAKQLKRRPATPTSTPSTSGNRPETTRQEPATRSRSTKSSSSIFSAGKQAMIFDKGNYTMMGIGFLLVLAGLAAMSGGAMPSPDVWDDNIIYSFQRITLAPMLMLAGFGLVVYGIFRRSNSSIENETFADTSSNEL